MTPLLKIGKTIFDLWVFVFLAALIGLWWTPELAQGNENASLFRATCGLIIVAGMFYKSVIVFRRQHSAFHFYFYTMLAIIAITGYLYGIATK